MSAGKKVIFLDRDGTINVDTVYVHKAEDWQWTKGAVAALKKLQSAGFVLAIVTNQSGIGHGMYTEQDMRVLHEFMLEELKKQDVSIAFIAYCPHKRDAGCECRKPGLGMAHQIEEVVGEIDYVRSWTIGDKMLDFEFGRNAGTQVALVRSSYWKEGDLEKQPDMIVDSLLQFANNIV